MKLMQRGLNYVTQISQGMQTAFINKQLVISSYFTKIKQIDGAVFVVPHFKDSLVLKDSRF